MARATAKNFFDLVRSSKLVENDRLDRFIADLRRRTDEAGLADVDFLAAQTVEAGLITEWQADKILEGRHKGFFLGKHKLLDHLGTGGMSSVYLAEHVLMQRRVAIKVLPKTRVDDASYLMRFEREARAIAAVNHPNIVRAYTLDNEGDIHYLVMEYVEGRDLQRIVKEDGPLSYEKVADYIRQSAAGLAYAHQRGLIHRDVKPANLMVDPEQTVRVLDLGLARFSNEEQASLTILHDENVLGTADYLAPEQAVDSHGVDGRADIYGLGCTLYFCLTGHPPFDEGTLPERLLRHQKDPPPPIKKDRPDAPNDLISICLKMMAKRPSARFQKMEQVDHILTKWLMIHGYRTEGPIERKHGSSGKLATAAGQAGQAEQTGKGTARNAPGGSSPGQKPQSRTSPPPTPSHGKPGPGGTPTPGTPKKPGSPAQQGTVSASNFDYDTIASSPKASQPSGGNARPRGPKRPPTIPKDDLSSSFPDLFAGLQDPSILTNPGDVRPLGSPIRKSRKREEDTRFWLWVAIGGGTCLAAILVLLVVFGRQW